MVALTACYRAFIFVMDKKEKLKLIKRIEKAERLIRNGESDLSTLAEYIQPLFQREVYVTWSTDGAVVVDDDGELGFLVEFINAL